MLACLALGVAAIATVGGLRSAVDAGLASHGREILGGDLEIGGGNEALPDSLRGWLKARGARISDVWQLRSMLIAGNGERELVELKAVDPAWPLVGTATVDPPQRLAAAEGGIVVEPLIQARRGNAMLPVSGVLTGEPDHAASPSLLGPRALIPLATLPRTGLIQPGSMVDHMLRVVWPAGADPAALVASLQRAFPDNGWRIRDVHDAVPGAARFIDQLSVFMSLVGLTSLLVGGIGVSTGVRAWLEGRARSIAILRCLGASGGTVFAVALIQVMLLSAAGVLIGMAAGAVLPLVALRVFRDVLPVPPELGIYPAPLALAVVFGALTALAFALLPLGRVLRIPGAALFRDALLPQGGRPPWALLAAVLALGVMLVALTVAASPDRSLAAGFCVAALATLAVFRLGAAGLMAAARGLRGARSATLRLGMGNLHRPGNATPLMLMALGLGLSTLAAVALIEGNMSAQIAQQLPKHAPSFYFIDIQPDELTRFEQVARGTPGVTDVEQVPSLVARVIAVTGVPVEQLHPTPDTAWAMKGDRGLTYAADEPAGTQIVAGQWWPAGYDGPPLLSFDSNLAHGWGVRLGDTITVSVLGRPVTLTIANLRQIDWRSLSMNFAMVASPGLLSGGGIGAAAADRRGGDSEKPGRHAGADPQGLADRIRRAGAGGGAAGLRDRVRRQLCGDAFRDEDGLGAAAAAAGHYRGGVRGADAGLWLCRHRGGAARQGGAAAAQRLIQVNDLASGLPQFYHRCCL